MEKTAATSSIIIPVLIFLVFLVFKLAGIGMIANWSWWWVTSPLWIGYALWILIMILYLILVLIGKLVERIANKK